MEALEAVPFTEKSDITHRRSAMARCSVPINAPHSQISSAHCRHRRHQWSDQRVSGGHPVMLRLYNEMGARALWANGCRKGDFVVNCFNYSLYAGGIMDHMAFETLGAGVLPYSVGRSERLLDLSCPRLCSCQRGSRILYPLCDALICRPLARPRAGTRTGSQISQFSPRHIFRSEPRTAPDSRVPRYRRLKNQRGMVAMGPLWCRGTRSYRAGESANIVAGCITAVVAWSLQS